MKMSEYMKRNVGKKCKRILICLQILSTLFVHNLPVLNVVFHFKEWRIFVDKEGKKATDTPPPPIAKFEKKRNKWNWIGEIFFFSISLLFVNAIRQFNLRVFFFLLTKSKRKLELFRYLTSHLNGNKRWDEIKKCRKKRTKTARVVDSIKKVAFWFAFQHSSKCRFDEQLLKFCREFKCMLYVKWQTKEEEEEEGR